MVFDIRGRRRHVVKVVYAVLAVLMGASLFLVVGPVNIGQLINNSSSSSSSSVFDDQAENIERKLAHEPKDETLLLALTRARINAGNSLVEVDPTSGQRAVTPEARAEFEDAAAAWGRYLKLAGENANPSAALLAANTFVTLAEYSTSYPEMEENIHSAVRAQRLFAEARPSINSLSNLARLTYFAFAYREAEKIGKEAAKFAHSKSEKQRLRSLLDETVKSAHLLQKTAKKAAKLEKSKSKEALEKPVTGFGGNPSFTP